MKYCIYHKTFLLRCKVMLFWHLIVNIIKDILRYKIVKQNKNHYLITFKWMIFHFNPTIVLKFSTKMYCFISFFKVHKITKFRWKINVCFIQVLFSLCIFFLFIQIIDQFILHKKLQCFY